MKQTINIFYVEDNLVSDSFTDDIWQKAETVSLNKYWSGADAPPERSATAGLLWTKDALFVRFDCQQHEPLIINENPQIDVEAEKLWERDVCEIFVAPDAENSEKYFEFEVAPTGEWLDYAIRQFPKQRQTDTEYNSGIKTAAQILQNSYSVIFCLKWQAFGKKPEAGEEWAGNLFRCVGAGASRGYLAWQPTHSAKPNFHIPAAFGIFKFSKQTSN